MRTFRMPLVGAVTVALLGVLSGAIVAQEDYPTSGTWMSLVESRCEATTRYMRTNQPNGDYQVRDLGVTCAASGDDPRFGSPMTWVLNEDCFADGGCVNWGTIEQPGADGSWSGWFAGTEDPGAMTHVTIVMIGSGDYDGLAHIRHATGPFVGPLDHSGVVFEGDCRPCWPSRHCPPSSPIAPHRLPATLTWRASPTLGANGTGLGGCGRCLLG